MDNINIEFHIEANVVDMVMEDIDIIILLENLFDNAIEAVEKCNDRKEIRFNIRNVNSMLILKIWNCSCKMPEVKKDRFITDKNDSKGHGWGLESVKYIVQKYNGSIEFEYGETFFEVIIIIGGE
ncbi:ATP-binding protein [Ruminococcus sp. AF41-9]|nr:ATP-binding protein [Ruminococcus sp. AF41-9]